MGVWIHVRVCIYPSLCLSVFFFFFLLICLSIILSAYLLIYLSPFLSVYPSNHLYIYLRFSQSYISTTLKIFSQNIHLEKITCPQMCLFFACNCSVHSAKHFPRTKLTSLPFSLTFYSIPANPC